MRSFLLALGFLTRLPVPPIPASRDDFAAAIRCYPLVGIVIGSIVVAAGKTGALVDPWVAAVAALAAWVAITGALHLDGLADLADGLGAAHGDRARLLAVMADPHVGSFGVATLVMHLLGKLVLLHACLPSNWAALILIPAVARIGPLVWARWLPPVKQGLGATIANAVRSRDLIGWGSLAVAAIGACPALIAAPFLIVAYAGWVRAKLGGINGDAHGAGIEIVELGLLLATAVASALR